MSSPRKNKHWFPCPRGARVFLDPPYDIGIAVESGDAPGSLYFVIPAVSWKSGRTDIFAK